VLCAQCVSFSITPARLTPSPPSTPSKQRTDCAQSSYKQETKLWGDKLCHLPTPNASFAIESSSSGLVSEMFAEQEPSRIASNFDGDDVGADSGTYLDYDTVNEDEEAMCEEPVCEKASDLETVPDL